MWSELYAFACGMLFGAGMFAIGQLLALCIRRRRRSGVEVYTLSDAQHRELARMVEEAKALNLAKPRRVDAYRVGPSNN
jgi:hypothetical protein